MTILELVVVGAAVLGGATVIMRKFRERTEKLALQQEVRIDTIHEVNEQITKLETTNLKDTESYKQAKAAYDEKYRNTGRAVTPAPGNNGGGKGS